jgi:anti-sigma B factor antagonist
MLTISHDHQGNKVVYQLHGRVDGDGAAQMQELLRGALKDGQYHLVLDLSHTNYLNSGGLRVLADLLTQCRQNGGDVKLAAPNPKIMRILEIIGFDKFFNVYPTVDAAVQS